MILDDILRQILLFLYSLLADYGLSIIALSLVVFIIMLPLFWFAENLQNKERIRKAEMQTLLDEIEAVKNKQEKYYYTKEIYKKYNYKAYYSLTGLIGLVIQIPFFLAAYWMLSDFEAFAGQSFGPIADLQQPDALLSIGVLKVNVLPFLMTMINLIAVYFMRDRLDKKEIKQLVGTAILFLVILYSVSSALVLYWTANNFFSIFKNKLLKSADKNYISNSTTLRDGINTYQKEIFNLLAILIGYFLFVHVVLTILDSQSLSSIVFLKLTLLTLLLVFVLSYFLKKGGDIFISITYTVFVLMTSIFELKSFSPDINEELIVNYCLISFGIGYLIRKINVTQKQKDEKSLFFMSKSHYFLFISLAIPLTVYVQSNSEYFSYISGFFFYLLMIGLPLVIFQMIWLLFKKSINQNIYGPSFLAVILTFYLVPIATDFTQLNSSNNYLPHLILLFFLIGVFTFVRRVDSKILPFLMISILAILLYQDYSNNDENQIVERNINAAEQFFDSQTILHKPNIYLLIYDSYVEENQLKRLYNIDNSEQMDFLKSQRFDFRRNVYSTGRSSLTSMSNVLNLSNIFDGVEEYRQRINGESVVNRILQINGYETHNILSPYFIRGSQQKVDYSYPSTGIGMFTIIKAILIGEFKFDIEFANGYDEWIVKKNEIMQTNNEKPIFLYSHSRYPGHSQNSGTLLHNETELFEKRLRKSNIEMKNDVNQILDKDKQSIIIIAGDHGPYLTGDGKGMSKYDDSEITRDDILDRYGVFLAIRYPEDWKSFENHKIDVLQEVLVSVLADMCEVRVPENLIGKVSDKMGSKRPPTIIDGIIQIGNSKGEPLYK